jgi:hypothetical protein
MFIFGMIGRVMPKADQDIIVQVFSGVHYCPSVKAIRDESNVRHECLTYDWKTWKIGTIGRVHPHLLLVFAADGYVHPARITFVNFCCITQ